MIVAGIDEAGYGPLLGPLVVSATAFEIAHSEGTPAELPLEPAELPCLWRLLKSAVAKKNARKGRLLIADSKVVHNLTDGDKLLERGVLTFFRTLDARPAETDGPMGNEPGAGKPEDLTVAGLLEGLGCGNHELDAHPWYTPQELLLPRLSDPGDLAIAGNMLVAALASARVKTLCLRTAVVSERAFNRLIGGTRNKASALVSITMSHLYHLHLHYGQRGLVVGVDKQGGRDHYTQLLLQCFPEAELKVLLESAEASSYLLQERAANGEARGRRTLIHFREKGETAFFATALASMMCKYLRELCMHSFNTWWCSRISGLRPTAGYYQDGSRWLLDVEPHLERLGVPREMLVRVR